jgi:hypothetical protein
MQSVGPFLSLIRHLNNSLIIVLSVINRFRLDQPFRGAGIAGAVFKSAQHAIIVDAENDACCLTRLIKPRGP